MADVRDDVVSQPGNFEDHRVLPTGTHDPEVGMYENFPRSRQVGYKKKNKDFNFVLCGVSMVIVLGGAIILYFTLEIGKNWGVLRFIKNWK